MYCPLIRQRRYCSHCLDTFSEDKTNYHFSTNLSLQKVFLRKLSKNLPNYVFPTLSTIIYRSTIAGAVIKYQENAGLAEYYICHDVKHFKLLDFDYSTQEELIKLGYETTIKSLKENGLL